jgi:hypothetical protein
MLSATYGTSLEIFWQFFGPQGVNTAFALLRKTCATQTTLSGVMLIKRGQHLPQNRIINDNTACDQ